ncbi:MAG: hydroxyphenylacetyl-CoA thioesterase PaaI [Brevibacterium aurantiacum]|nr:hydroxyphenylacetyl-CoA thioesterase PaaI [Brevibacterium aurantiacum]
MLRDDLASGALGIEVIDVGPGTATAAMTITDTMVNGHAIGHGGYVFLLADTAFAYACNSYGVATVAASADITFIAPVYAGDRLTAVGVERAKWGRSGIYDITVSNQARVVAEFRGNSRTIAR